MGYIVAIDTSGNWKYIACVVTRVAPRIVVRPHIASLNRKVRKKVIDVILSFIASNGYALCSYVNLCVRVRSYKGTANKHSVWRSLLKFELSRVVNHLRDKGYWPIYAVYVDREFELFRSVVESIFQTNTVIIGKNEYVLLADVVGYVNLREKKLLKKYRNIVEL